VLRTFFICIILCPLYIAFVNNSVTMFLLHTLFLCVVMHVLNVYMCLLVALCLYFWLHFTVLLEVACKLSCYYKVATEPPMDLLISKLFHRTASHDAVRIKWSVCPSTVVIFEAWRIHFRFDVPIVFSSPFTLAPYVFIVVTALGPVFLCFSKLSKHLL